jgi:hypothetical protein
MDRGVLLGADHLSRRILHGDHFLGTADFDGQGIGARMLRQFLADHVFLTDQDHAQIQFGYGANRSFDFRFRGVVAPHCVYRNRQHGSAQRYSSTTSTTSRPLYFPQRGHTRCGSLGSWQLGHSDRTDRVSES